MHKPNLRSAILLLALAIAVLTPPTARAQDLGRLLEQASIARAYRHVSPGEMLQVEYLFLRVFQGERSTQLRQEWLSLGFNMQLVNDHGTEFVVLYESEGKRYGRGLYAFRQALPYPLALQAPHSFKEYYTRQIVLDMMREGNVAAAAWNTVPRLIKQYGATIDADLAHQEYSFFKAFSRAFAIHYAHGRILQIHGFAQQKRTTQAGATADMIISSGRQIPTPAVLAAGQCLKQRIAGPVHIYPRDVLELGATTNAIGRALMQLGHSGFVHLEISRGLRERMRNNASMRQSVLQCMATTRS
ncbi:hypothetical protein [Candidatus Entotheonella palauensis]|uniref:Uncharacterized protein n=1 Tax=Candidatus Entotheonella gemina TaxID=1429439 RepID=W4LUT9_9BACT|nr:hypothetical protein [Candidatus Entotheonella palauensis]ETX01207.1 MAG: hypothetical protein ETSY2_37685 [Candidatus Entotheonella gemina]